jgi:hypothetical protein
MSTADADKRYNADRDDHKATFQLSGEYAKWFISTLLLLNSGAIAGIFQKGASVKWVTPPAINFQCGRRVDPAPIRPGETRAEPQGRV